MNCLFKKTLLVEGVFVRCRFFKGRRENGLFKPGRENRKTNYDIGDWSKENIKAFFDDEGWTGIQVTRFALVGDLGRSIHVSNGWKEKGGVMVWLGLTLSSEL